jgi:hypothetical protein
MPVLSKKKSFGEKNNAQQITIIDVIIVNILILYLSKKLKDLFINITPQRLPNIKIDNLKIG